jgi:hypothetical protein
VVVSTASLLVKGALFLIAIPVAWHSFHFGKAAPVLIRIAAGLITQHGGVFTCPAYRQTALGYEILSNLVSAEPRQVDTANAIEPEQIGDRVGQLVRTVRSSCAVRAQQ